MNRHAQRLRPQTFSFVTTFQQRGRSCYHRLDRQRRCAALTRAKTFFHSGASRRANRPPGRVSHSRAVRLFVLCSYLCADASDTLATDPVGFETDIMSSEGGGATSDTDVRPHSFAAPQSRASEQQLRAEIQRLEQRYAQTVSSMTQERQEALANEAAFTRMARDSSQQLQLKLADAESKIEFLAAFVSTQVPRLANFFFFLQQLLT